MFCFKLGYQLFEIRIAPTLGLCCKQLVDNMQLAEDNETTASPVPLQAPLHDKVKHNSSVMCLILHHIFLTNFIDDCVASILNSRCSRPLTLLLLLLLH
jgi:hypothetical protein